MGLPSSLTLVHGASPWLVPSLFFYLFTTLLPLSAKLHQGAQLNFPFSMAFCTSYLHQPRMQHRIAPISTSPLHPHSKP
jgi:hypothetical protein